MQRIKKWEDTQVGNFEVFIEDYEELDKKWEDRLTKSHR